MNRFSFVTGFAVLSILGCSGAAQESPSGSEQADLASHVPVDRPGKARTPATDVKKVTMKYFGGPVIPNPKVYVVWWGDPSKLNPVVTAAHGGMADFFAGITNSSYLDWLNEYNTTVSAQAGSHLGKAGTDQRMGRGSYAKTITLADVPAGNVTDAQVQATLDVAFDAGTLPAPDENTIYAVFFPQAVRISLPDGASCSSFGGYHEATVEKTRHSAYYLVLPDCGDSLGGFTRVASHELVEAMTDPFPTPGSSPDFPQAWNDAAGSEVGDLCEASAATIATPSGSFSAQGIWDEQSAGCPTFRAYARDYNVSFAATSSLAVAGKSSTFTVQTATTAGKAQPLTLSVTAPAGVVATLSSTKLTSGGSATLTVTAPSAAAAQQVVVRADGTTGKAAQTHTAALLLDVSAP